jgi:Uma2 family endonuclease
MPVSERTYLDLALQDPEGHWELYCGRPRRKPGMTLEHNRLASEVYYALRRQLNPAQFDVRVNMGHLRLSSERYYIPDVFVVPTQLQAPLRGTRALETYRAPLPLVVEVWSPSTGDYDVEVKLREYQLRGDLEIWRLHPYERTLISWQRQSDGSYVQQLHSGGLVRPVALPDVVVDLDTLFD